ncbi:clr5 domain-containing protein [Hirsutella rhossiliensis]|uniref:Clr5 domain-containing protein n=1 Tax=Hirsutella rhossiliensis TaxID=111463 RepID=A0A9P8N2H8_9HYPO|nr:clr5 domain-containing protein [Hirsutella rhossiliensis]KAH0963522.1 clr5 domain-containing protein [Hirsutella rhossiliensis]
MGPPRPQPTEEEWLRHKPAIRRLYLVEQMPLKNLVVEVANLGLTVTKAQLEYKLKQWDFRKNISKERWASIDSIMAKRRREGKDKDKSGATRLFTSAHSRVSKRCADYRLHSAAAPRGLRMAKHVTMATFPSQAPDIYGDGKHSAGQQSRSVRFPAGAL